MSTSSGILAAWPTAAAYLQGTRKAPAPSSAGESPADVEPGFSSYRAQFRAKLKACQLEAALSGESTNPRHLFGKVNERMREANRKRDSKVLNSWNEGRMCRAKAARGAGASGSLGARVCVRLDGHWYKRVRPHRTAEPKPSSAGASGAAAAPADTSTATATVTSAEVPASAKGDDTFALSALLEGLPPTSAAGERGSGLHLGGELLGVGSSAARAAEPSAAACGGKEPAAEPSPAGSDELSLSMFLSQ